MTAHKHAALMAQYAQDWAETDEPWKRWEVASSSDNWGALCSHPYWNEEYEYRRKPRTLTYTVTIPVPLRGAPEVGTIVYMPTPLAEELYGCTKWDGMPIELRLLKRGLCFATREDAIAAAKAMMPIKGEEV